MLVALFCTGLWAGAMWLGHSSGHLRFLDRLESALTDMRTLARGAKAPPDLVTIVAVDDTIVKLAGTYPLPRAEIARIVEAIAQLEPKVIAIDLLLVASHFLISLAHFNEHLSDCFIVIARFIGYVIGCYRFTH